MPGPVHEHQCVNRPVIAKYFGTKFFNVTIIIVKSCDTGAAKAALVVVGTGCSSRTREKGSVLQQVNLHMPRFYAVLKAVFLRKSGS